MGEGTKPPESDSYAKALQEVTQRYERLVQSLSILRQLDETNDLELDTESICRHLVESIASGLASENCSLMLWSKKEEYLELRAACSPFEDEAKSFAPGAWQGRTFREGEGIVGHVLETGEGIRVEDVLEEKRFDSGGDAPVAIRSLMCFPLFADGGVLGVLNLSHSDPDFFSLEDEHTMVLIAERAARILSIHFLHEKLRESEEHYRLVAENAGDAILVFGMRGNVLSANQAVESISGIPAERFANGSAHWDSGIHAEDRRKYMGHRTELITTQAPCTVEYRYRDARGVVRELEQRSAPLLSPSGSVTGFVCIVRDATERKREEEERLRLETQVERTHELADLGTMTSNIASDFEAQLAGILREVDLASEELSLSRAGREHLEEIIRATQRTAELCRQLKAGSGHGGPVQPVDLNAVIEGCMGRLQALAGSEVMLRFALGEALPKIAADTDLVEEAVWKLLEDACETMGQEGGNVTVLTEVMECGRDFLDRIYFGGALAAGLYVALEVSNRWSGNEDDAGEAPGTSAVAHARDGSSQDVESVLDIARNREVGIEVEHTGAHDRRVRMVFRMDGEAADESRSAREAGVLAEGLTVLVMDDEKLFRIFSKNVLERSGFSVLVADNAEEGIRLFREHADDLSAVVLDAALPFRSDADVLDALMDIREDVPVILTLRFNEGEPVPEMQAKAHSRFLRKPFRIEELLSQLHAAIEA